MYGAAAADLAIERARDSLAHEGYPVRRINALIAGSDRAPTYLGGNPCFANNAKLPNPPDSLNLEPNP